LKYSVFKDELKNTMESIKSLPVFPSTFNSITFAATFLVDGVVVLSLGILFMKYQDDLTPLVATTIAGGYLAYRRICSVILPVGGGWIADNIGIDRAFTISLTFIIGGLLLTIVGWVGAGASIIFTFYSINSVLTPASICKHNSDMLSAVSENATWRDIGAAVGALAGGFLLTSNFQHILLLFGTFGLMVLLSRHIGSVQKMRELLLWK
jgi:DHA1 family multidrug resistance protein-like MFS transporter